MTGLSGIGTRSVARDTSAYLTVPDQQNVSANLSGTAWNATNITFSFPTLSSNYGTQATYGDAAPFNGFAVLTAQQQGEVLRAFSLLASYTALTFTQMPETDSSHAAIRLINSTTPPTAYAFYPSTNVRGGDVFYGGTGDNPVIGNFDSAQSTLHEIGHALGLKHGQDGTGYGVTNADRLDIEFSIMDYANYIGSAEGFGTARSSPSSYMMYDIAALQYMYGANFSKVGQNVTYTWSAATGEQFVNGVSQGAPTNATIFETIWTNGATSTFDLSNFGQDQVDDMSPGGWMNFSSSQRADLGYYGTPGPGSVFARANVYNAFLSNGDPRSLITNIITGAGNDTVTGNFANNSISTGAGNDTIYGSYGNDTISGGANFDTVIYFLANSPLTVNMNGSNGTVTKTIGTDTLTSIEKVVGMTGDDTFYILGTEGIDGSGGNDTANFYQTVGGIVAVAQGGGGTVTAGAGVVTFASIERLVGTSSSDVFYVDAGEYADGGVSGFDYLIELTPGVTLLAATNFTRISEIVTNVGTNVVDASQNPDIMYLYGSTGSDTLKLGFGGGYAFGGGGSNVLSGGNGVASITNILIASDPTGTNVMNGGNGNATNYFYVNGGQDTVNGAGHFNVVIEQVDNVTFNGVAASHVQEVITRNGTNVVDGTGSTDFLYLYGGTGNDTLTTGTGGGYLIAGGGSNTLHGGGGINVFIADNAAGVDHMLGGAGSNIYYIDATSAVAGAGTFNTVIELQSGVSLTLGSAQLGSNVQQVILNGGTNLADFSSAASGVYLYGGTGNDTLKGGTGSDNLWGGAGANVFVFQSNWGSDTIRDWGLGSGNVLDLTALAGLGVHSLSDITQGVVSGALSITSSHTGASSITLAGYGSALGAGSFLFA